MYSVYIHTVNENGKRYVGQCTGDPYKRWGAAGHRYKGQFFYKAIEKYGWNNITHEIVATNLTLKEADKLEKELISKYKTNKRQYGYNIASGGRDGAGSPGGKNHNARPVVCIETNQIWECANYCAKDIGVNPASLQESLYNGYRCKGFHYRYIDDESYIAKNPHSVQCIETGQIWKTVQECAVEVGVTPRTIWRYCSGNRKCPPGRTYKYCVV
jgi:hypothetical protein